MFEENLKSLLKNGEKLHFWLEETKYHFAQSSIITTYSKLIRKPQRKLSLNNAFTPMYSLSNIDSLRFLETFRPLSMEHELVDDSQ